MEFILRRPRHSTATKHGWQPDCFRHHAARAGSGNVGPGSRHDANDPENLPPHDGFAVPEAVGSANRYAVLSYRGAPDHSMAPSGHLVCCEGEPLIQFDLAVHP